MTVKKNLTKKIIWMFAIGQLGWSTLSAIVTNWVISFYEPNEEMLEAGQTVFLPQGRVILGLVRLRLRPCVHCRRRRRSP